MVRVRTRQKNNRQVQKRQLRLAHRTMLIFYREVDRRDLGKTKEKNVYVGFFIVFLGVHQSDSSISLILIIKSLHLLIDFAFGLPSSYADHYLKRTLPTFITHKDNWIANKTVCHKFR